MIGLLATASCALLAPMLAVALYNLATAPRLEKAPNPRSTPRVSLLVPARNEAISLEESLPRLLALDYPRLEIRVLDDGSEDGTAAVVERLAAGDPRLRPMRGAPLPPGWLGKNWACHQLADAAEGDLLVFCDADVLAEPAALSRTVALLETSGAVTAIPRQRMGGWVEKAVIPLVAQLPVVALLPLRAVATTRSPSIAMANGQWLAFRREVYRSLGGHAAVRSEVVEDVALGRLVKLHGGRLSPVLAPELLAVRMYSGAREVREGFGKNLYPLVGGRPVALAVALAVFALAAIYPWAGVLVGSPGAGVALGLLAALRVVASRCCGLGWRSVALHPAGSLLVAAIAMDSFAAHRGGRARWKGRSVVAGVARDAVPGPEDRDRRDGAARQPSTRA